ncbi:MAG: hypothetical protein OXT06_30270 [Rhodospirillaceae bacterium]|nr:hypothetical protein [Rhodospirillaceae bacterium]MDD9924376.1 hypothetical protein [Rhodospirillaceae bacterium]
MTPFERSLVFAGIASALVAYAIGAWDSPLLDRERRAQREFVSRYALMATRDETAEQVLAERYWTRYGDVAADANFGRNGSFGIWGAREHFNRHGRREGRHWPKSTPRAPGSGVNQR